MLVVVNSDAEHQHISQLVAQIEPDLYGLTVQEARGRVASHAGLSLRPVGVQEPVVMSLSPGQITVYVDDGVIVDPATIEEMDD